MTFMDVFNSSTTFLAIIALTFAVLLSIHSRNTSRTSKRSNK
jgi:hypothetical protein